MTATRARSSSNSTSSLALAPDFWGANAAAAIGAALRERLAVRADIGNDLHEDRAQRVRTGGAGGVGTGVARRPGS